ncbi:MAG: dihydroneopterin aldolase [Anaerolineales bacterium]|nr:dihydroneopterin aldolase [Anaerolineales bacterium]
MTTPISQQKRKSKKLGVQDEVRILGVLMDKIFIKDLVARGIIGVNDWERENPQEMLINITAFTNIRRAAQTDDLADCLDYSALAQKVQAHAETAARFTVEALAEDLAEICLREKGVEKVIVRVEKPGAVRFASSVGVEIERTKSPE